MNIYRIKLRFHPTDTNIQPYIRYYHVQDSADAERTDRMIASLGPEGNWGPGIRRIEYCGTEVYQIVGMDDIMHDMRNG